MEQEKPISTTLPPEREWTGPLWRHPYVIYVLLTVVLFGFLVVMAWLAWTNDWLPRR